MKSMLLQRIRLLYVSGFVVSAVFMASCSDDDTDKNAVYDPNKPVVLESYSPQEGGVGTKLIIRGENFGYDPSKVKVRIANDETGKPASSAQKATASMPSSPRGRHRQGHGNHR